MYEQFPAPREPRAARLWHYADRDIPRAATIVVLATLIAGVGVLVHATGGIKYVYSHAMYLPVVLAGAMFRTPGGVLAGVAGGLVLGPWMPIDTATGEPQELINWLYRMFFFCLIGALSGFLFAAMRQHIDRIQWLSEHDVHTGLPNRAFLERTLRAQLQRKSLAPEFLVIVVNIENYLEIINTLGPDVSRPLMSAIHERLRTCLPEDSLLCQYHTDRFVAVRRRGDAAQVARDITLALRRSFHVADIHVYVDASIGMARFPLHGHDSEELIQKASIAMHASMKQGLAWSTYDNQLDQTNRETLTLLGLIPAALTAGEFKLHCQPKLRLFDRTCTGAEMLMRWRHPVRGDIAPGSFIPHAERTSLIHLLTKWALEESFVHHARWLDEIPGIQVAINLTARDLGDPDLPGLLDALARKHGLNPASIEFEITETGILADQQSAARLLQVIKSYGFRIAIDDFGTGQSSLQYLKNLPIDNLKIDQIFVRNLLSDEHDQSIVKTVIAMAHNLGLEVTAEGVEDPATIEYLRELGCTYAQGYAIARPFPAEDLTGWIRNDTGVQDPARRG